MGIINILDTQTANMIAAGEVVDRPASVIKELLENSVDAGAKNISVKIKGGGNLHISVSDDGCGITRDDLPKSLLRHATSKIKCGDDIDGVKTLGFRGEALAAISSVCRLEIISKRHDDVFGNRLSSDENGVELYEAGCPDGTTIIVNDLFYNMPARRKFMKKDVSESAACVAVCEKLALSHPEIAILCESETVQKLKTSGDGKLSSVIYSLYGSETLRSFVQVDNTQDKITVCGYISKPESPRGSRNMQSFFINGRYVKSKTVQAAVEEAYKSFIQSGKYPAAILMISCDHKSIDVNVHPAKTEIKFSDERAVFSAVYYAIRSVISNKTSANASQNSSNSDTTFDLPNSADKTEKLCQSKISEKRRFESEKPFSGYEIFRPTKEDYELSPLRLENSSTTAVCEKNSAKSCLNTEDDQSNFVENQPNTFKNEQSSIVQTSKSSDEITPPIPDSPPPEQPDEQQSFERADAILPFKIIGEAYNTYIFAEFSDKILIVDKHAAHERILYEELKNRNKMNVQQLLFPITITLSQAECDVLADNAEYLKTFGFVLEEFGNSMIAVRTVPARLKAIDELSQILEGFARDLTVGTAALSFEEKCDKALYTMACKAAIKAGDRSYQNDDEFLVGEILSQNLKYCPHGRPFIKEISKREIEKYFDR